MKNTIITIASLAAMALAGCTKSAPETVKPREGGETCRLTVSLSDGAATKVTGQSTANEFKIQNIQIFVFRSGSGADAGVLDACASKGFDSPLDFDASRSDYEGLSLDCTVGARKIYAIVNAARDQTSYIGTEAQLLGQTIALPDISKDKLFMINSTETELESGAKTVKISVRRVCASVILQSVKNDMQAAVYRQSEAFKIKGIYLMNLPSRVNYALNLAPSSLSSNQWYSWQNGPDADVKVAALTSDTLTDADGNGKTLNYGNSYNVAHTFYTFPNDCPPSVEKEWSARATRLVVAACYKDGNAWHDCYYPITLYDSDSSKGLESNKQYRVNLTIRRPGSDSPLKPVEFNTLTGSISVEDWETGQTYEEII